MNTQSNHRERAKVFGIGLAKTSTSSLYHSLEILGYATVQFPRSPQQFETHDAFVDIPVADAFEELDRRFPGSKFIYTTREISSWIASSQTHWRRYVEAGRQDDVNTLAIIGRLYGATDFDEDRFRAAYVRHDNRVRDYFRERPDDLLILEIRKDADNWGPLCDFLSCSRPKVEFPFANRKKSEVRWQVDSTLPIIMGNPVVRNRVTAYVTHKLRKITRKTSKRYKNIITKRRI